MRINLFGPVLLAGAVLLSDGAIAQQGTAGCAPAGSAIVAQTLMRRGFMASGISRTSSIRSKPLSKPAVFTCTWSARLNCRLKGRAEIPSRSKAVEANGRAPKGSEIVGPHSQVLHRASWIRRSAGRHPAPIFSAGPDQASGTATGGEKAN